MSRVKFTCRPVLGSVPVLFASLAFVASTTLATVLVTTANGFSGFQNVARQSQNWNTSSLATATVISQQSNNLLYDIKKSLRDSLTASSLTSDCYTSSRFYPSPKPEQKKANNNSQRNSNTRARLNGTGYSPVRPLPPFQPSTSHSTSSYTSEQGTTVTTTSCTTRRIYDGDNYNGTQRNNNINIRANLLRTFIQEMSYINQPTNKIRQTLNYGLEQGKPEHKEANIFLLNSRFLEPKINANDPSLASTMISLNKGRELNNNDLQRYLSGGSLRVSSELLTAMIGDHHNRDFLERNPEQYGVIFDEQGLSFDTLPTGVKLALLTNQKKKLSNKKFERISVDKFSTAQLRFEKTTIPNPVCPDGSAIPASGHCLSFCDKFPQQCKEPPPQIASPTEENPNAKELRFSFSSGNPEMYDLLVANPNLPISEDNPLYIVRKTGDTAGQYAKVYQDLDGNIIYEHGFGLNTDGLSLAEDTEFAAFANNTNVNIDFDAYPRPGKRFGKLDSGFYVNGIEIPDGAVLVATIGSDGTKRNSNDLGTPNNVRYYGEVRVYDPDTGVLLGIFEPGDFTNSEMRSVIDSLQENSRRQKGSRGETVLGKFNASELFNNPRAFANVQRDINDRIDDHINTVSGGWGKDTRQDTGTKIESTRGPIIGVPQAVDEIAQAIKDSKDRWTVKLDQAIARIRELKAELRAAKSKSKRDAIAKQLADARRIRDKRRNKLKERRKDFDDYMRKRKIPNWVKNELNLA